MNKSFIIRRIGNLLAVKSLVTIAFTATYCYLLICQLEIPESFQNIYLMIIGFYFGSQAEKVHASAAEPRIEVVDNSGTEPLLTVPRQGGTK